MAKPAPVKVRPPQPPAQILNVPIADLNDLPGGARTFARKAKKWGWEWEATYSLVPRWSAGQVQDWRMYHSFIVGIRPPGWETNHATGQWDGLAEPEVDNRLEATYSLRYQILHPRLYPLLGGKRAGNHIASLFALARSKE